MAVGVLFPSPTEPLPYRPDIERPEPAPFESTRSGQTLVVRLHHDDDGSIVIEVPLDDPDPDTWQFLDVWIVEFMDTGRSEPISVSDTETRYRLD